MNVTVKRLFDGIATRYDTLNHLLSAGRDKAWRRDAAALADLRGSPAILDLCGGTGDFLHSILQGASGQSKETLGIVADFSLPMLRGSRGKFAQTSARVQRAGVDALALPFKPNSFDAVFCGYGIRNLDDWHRGLQAIHQVLKPGGVFITLEFFRPETLFTRLFYGVIAPLAIPLIGGLMSRKAAYEYLVSSIRAFAPVEDYAEGCRSLGFQKVSVKACDFGITHIVIARKPESL